MNNFKWDAIILNLFTESGLWHDTLNLKFVKNAFLETTLINFNKNICLKLSIRPTRECFQTIFISSLKI